MTAPRREATPVGGGLWVVASVVVPNLFVLVLSVAIDRELGAGGLGRQSVIAFAATAATTLAGAGGFVAIVRSVAAALDGGDAPAARATARWGLRLHGATGLVAGAVVAAPALWVTHDRAAWLLAAAVTALGTLQMVPMAVLVGAQRWRDANVVGLATGAVAVPATIAVLGAGGGIEGIVAVEVVVVAVNLLWAGALARRAIAGPARDPSPDRPATAPSLRFAGLSAVGVVITVVVWRRSELVILAWRSSDVEVARYSVAFAVSAVLLTLSERFSAALTAAFSGLVSRDDADRLRAARGRALRLLLAATLPLVGCAAALGPATIRVFYGDEYARSGAVLLVLLAAAAALPVWTVSAAVLAAHGDATSPLAAGLAAAAIDVALSIPLIDGHGALGAAVASLVGQVTAIGAMGALARRRAGPTPWDLDALGRTLVVAVGAGAAAWAVTRVAAGPLGLAAAAAAAVVALAVLARVATPLTAADAAWLTRSLEGRAGRWAGSLLTGAARRPTTDDYPDPDPDDRMTSS